MFCYKSVNPASHVPIITRLCPAISIITNIRTLSGTADPLQGRLWQTKPDNDGPYLTFRKVPAYYAQNFNYYAFEQCSNI